MNIITLSLLFERCFVFIISVLHLLDIINTYQLLGNMTICVISLICLSIEFNYTKSETLQRNYTDRGLYYAIKVYRMNYTWSLIQLLFRVIVLFFYICTYIKDDSRIIQIILDGVSISTCFIF